MTVLAIVVHLHSNANEGAVKQVIERFGADAVQALPMAWLVKTDTPAYEIMITIRSLLSDGEQALVMGVSPGSVISMAPELAPSVHEWLVKNF